jgi:hypothetical protein
MSTDIFTFRPTLSRQVKESGAYNGQEAVSALTPAGNHGTGIEHSLLGNGRVFRGVRPEAK